MLEYSAELSLPESQFALLVDYVDEVLAVPDFDGLVGASRNFFEGLGANAVNFGIFDSSAELIGASTNMRQSWIDQYWLNDYVSRDPMIAHFRTGTRPAIHGWRREWASYAYDEAGGQVMRGVSESGYPNILFQPVRIPGRDYSGGVAIFTDLPDSESGRHLDHYGGLFTLAATCAGQRAAHLFRPGHAGKTGDWVRFQRPVLSPREIEVLKWLSRGLRADQIAHKIDLRPVTVHMHIASARRKLGANTREQLMCLAVLRGYV